MRDLTFLVKTFERPGCLVRCLRSLRRHCPQTPVVVVDDSFTPYARTVLAEQFPDSPMTAYHLPPDTGISAGRNYALEHMTTPYFVLLDDDHVLRPDSHVDRMRATLVEGGWDIVGGTYVQVDQNNQPYVLCWEGELVRIDTMLVCRALRMSGDVSPCDIVNNYFVAKTEAVRSIGGWDPELKILEHVDFFLRAGERRLRVAHLRGAFVDHRPQRSAGYNRYRVDRVGEYRQMWLQKHGISHYIDFLGRVFVYPPAWRDPRRPITDYSSSLD